MAQRGLLSDPGRPGQDRDPLSESRGGGVAADPASRLDRGAAECTAGARAERRRLAGQWDGCGIRFRYGGTVQNGLSFHALCGEERPAARPADDVGRGGERGDPVSELARLDPHRQGGVPARRGSRSLWRRAGDDPRGRSPVASLRSRDSAMRYSIFSLLRQAFAGHRGWEPAWRDATPKPAYDVIIVGGGGHGLATAHYLAKVHGITEVAVLEKGWIGLGNAGRNTTIIRSNYLLAG